MAKKRANGEGNIRKRSDGRWEGRYTAGYNTETGKRIIKNAAPTSTPWPHGCGAGMISTPSPMCGSPQRIVTT